MLWYLLKTWVGGEEELVQEIRRTVPAYRYHECFVLYQERIWRKQQRSVVHRETLFPGCVFLTCRETGAVLPRMERVPGISRLAASGSLAILPMMREDGEFLEKLSGEDHVVRLSYVRKDGEGRVCGLSGPLETCQEQVEKYQFKKRYAMVRHRLWGEDRVIVLGILLKEDVERKLLYENRETHSVMEVPVEKIPAWEMA